MNEVTVMTHVLVFSLFLLFVGHLVVYNLRFKISLIIAFLYISNNHTLK